MDKEPEYPGARKHMAAARTTDSLQGKRQLANWGNFF